MSSYASLSVKDKECFSYRNGVVPEILSLFFTDELLHFTGSEAAKYTDSWDTDNMSPEEIEEIEAFIYLVTARVLKDRLDVLGFSEPILREIFEASHETAIEEDTRFAQMFSNVIEHVEERLNALQKLTYEAWLQQIDAILVSEQSDDNKRPLSIDGPLAMLKDDDDRFALRAILEHLDDQEIVKLDLTDVITGGWIEENHLDSTSSNGWEYEAGVPIIITEGTYDVQVLKATLEILKPHLVPYIRFLDYSFKNEGSASVAVSTLKSFAAAGIHNRIVAIFDNDSAAYEAVSVLKEIKLPPQYKVIHYPDIDLAKDYPTLGPQGNVSMNVNRLAGSIELYLGTDVLRDDEGNFMPVQWKGYMSKIKAYQGELLNKASIQRAFYEKLKLAKTDRKNVKEQDWSGLNAVLDTLIATLSEL